MKRLLHFISLALTLLLAPALHAADSPQFRGPDRDGIFAESGLLRSWPEGGPKLLWSYDGLGEGYASVSVAGGRIYTTGSVEQKGSVFAFDRDGELLWKKEYGPSHHGGGFPGTRTTPTVDGGALFLLSSMGKAVSLDAGTGAVRWQVDVLEKFGGKNIQFGVSESPLVLDGKVIFTPGGTAGSVVALDPESGKTVWATEGLTGNSAYCNPRLFDDGKRRQIVTFLAQHMVAVDPDTGEALWQEPYKAPYDIHAVSPLFDGDLIYTSHGYREKGKLYQLAADGRSVKLRWTDSELDVHHGGAVLLDGRVYGAASNGGWYALDLGSGEVVASIRRLGKGAVVYADGLLYGYLENGKVVLVDPDPKNFREISSFEIEKGSGQHWAHPVVSGGVLYLRHGEVLMAFDVAAGE